MQVQRISGVEDGLAAASHKKTSSGEGFAAAMQESAAKIDAASELEAYVKMTPAQRLRWQILQKLGITEEELAAMPPEKRKVYEEKIRELMEQAMKQSGKKDPQQQAAPDAATAPVQVAQAQPQTVNPATADLFDLLCASRSLQPPPDAEPHTAA
ncbi:hypothetical protein [Massilia sp. TS11]|uniref:hypothetical protein n=1 Tax=Massilia sp. TS11 TaxID=2908003 RepID=UPI001EDBE495|nr:hypothetical protein [Massilia sp. TS11]MCG2586846.1 hypothetical protein [Massilia sp. TS11]